MSDELVSNPEKRAFEPRRRNGTTGRFQKLNGRLRRKLCELISERNQLDWAAGQCGISRSTFYAWLKKGENDIKAGVESEHSKLFEDIDAAKCEWEAKLLKSINEAGKESWQAHAWLLERKMPDKYGRKDRLDIGIAEAIKNEQDRIQRELETVATQGPVGLLAQAESNSAGGASETNRVIIEGQANRVVSAPSISETS